MTGASGFSADAQFQQGTERSTEERVVGWLHGGLVMVLLLLAKGLAFLHVRRGEYSASLKLP